MILAVQHTAQIFTSLILASTMGLSLAIGVAGAFHHRFPLECAACQAVAGHAATHVGSIAPVVVASTR